MEYLSNRIERDEYGPGGHHEFFECIYQIELKGLQEDYHAVWLYARYLSNRIERVLKGAPATCTSMLRVSIK